MERVGSFNAYNQLIQYGSKLQASLFEYQKRLATSTRGEYFHDVAGETQHIQNMQNSSIKMEYFISSAKNKLSELEAKHGALKTIADLLIRAKSTSANAMGASTDEKKYKSINHVAKQLLNELESLLNRKHDNSYLFGGSIIDHQPVKIRHAQFKPQKAPSSADDKYYLGNNLSTYITLNDENVLQDSVNASDPAIEKAIRAIGMLTNIKPSDRKSAAESFSLLKDAINGVSSMLHKTGALSKSIKEGIRANQSVKHQMEKILTDLTKVDAAKVMADMANLQVSLQASYTSIAKMSQFNLLNYLR